MQTYLSFFPQWATINKQALSSMDLTLIMLKTPLESFLFQAEPVPFYLLSWLFSQSLAAPRNQRSLKKKHKEHGIFYETKSPAFCQWNKRGSAIRNHLRNFTLIFFQLRSNTCFLEKIRKKKHKGETKSIYDSTSWWWPLDHRIIQFSLQPSVTRGTMEGRHSRQRHSTLYNNLKKLQPYLET